MIDLPLTKYQKIIDKLPLAAKAMLLATILGISFIIWYYSFWQDLRLAMNNTYAKIEILESTIPKLEEQIKIIKSAPKDTAKNKAESPDTSGHILLPNQINKVLHDLLTTTGNLSLIQLDNSPPKEVMLPLPPSPSNPKAFEHGVIIKFSGDYFSTMRYLQAIENLKWKISWDKLEYNVMQYPNAEITLYVHTVSNDGDWIHV